MLEAKERYFYPEMSVAEAMTLHPRAGEVFMAFHLGGCGSCGISEFHILKDVCASYGVDVNVLIDVLEGLMEREPLTGSADAKLIDESTN